MGKEKKRFIVDVEARPCGLAKITPDEIHEALRNRYNSNVGLKVKEIEEAPTTFLEHPETHMEGIISYEQSISRGSRVGDLGIQIARDHRVWLCVDGEAMIRFKPKVVGGKTQQNITPVRFDRKE